jgi:hypothetical protein
MLTLIVPFHVPIDATTIAGVSLWSLALYLGLWSVSEWVMQQLLRGFNFAERSLYFSTAKFDRPRDARNSQNAFYASMFSIVPFLAAGSLCNWAVEVGLGRSWSVSIGIIVCISGGVYELGRRDGQSLEDD